MADFDANMKIGDISPETIQKGKETVERTLGQNEDKTIPEFQEEFTRTFDKRLCFSNIRELLKSKPNVKLGQIEKDAGCQPGYMSRLEKSDNTTEPSIGFIVTAARLLGVSVEALISINLAELTPTEKYLESFLDKLIKDTLADKLEWQLSRAESLNHMDCDMNGNVDHPLFNFNVFMVDDGTGYPTEKRAITFTSDSFGQATQIYDDCFSLKIKNGSIIYLMDIEKYANSYYESTFFAKEIWIYTPGTGCSLLARNNDNSALAETVNSVFSTVKERTKHPVIPKAHQYVLDAFMNDDLNDDPPSDEELPF